MPSYVFKNAKGELEEHYLPMGEAPPFGSTIVLEGRSLTRVVTAPRANAREDVHFTDITMDPWTPGMPRYDKDGMGQFHSLKECHETAAKLTHMGKPTTYDRK